MGRTVVGQSSGPTISDATVANLRAEIARQQQNRQSFGARMGWSKNTTTNKLAGRSRLTVDELARAADLLEVDILVLLAVPAPRQEAS